MTDQEKANENIDTNQTTNGNKSSTKTYISLVSILLIFLYSLQGFVIGLFLETIQLRLKKDFSFAEVGIFLLCSYPFSLKVLWSPIVDTYYIKSLGLRRTWAISSQLIVSGLLYFLSYNINFLIESKKIYELSFICFTIKFFIATQDIAIDGWATTLCGKDVINYLIFIKFKFLELFFSFFLPNYRANYRHNFFNFNIREFKQREFLPKILK